MRRCVNNIRLIFLKELKDVLRDKRTLFVMLLLPIILYPVLMLGMTALTVTQVSKIRAEKMAVEIWGASNGEDLVDFIKEKNEPPAEKDAKKNAEKHASMNLELEINSSVPTDNETELIKNRVRDKELKAALVIPEGFREALKAESNASVVFIFDRSDERSDSARARLEKAVGRYSETVLKERAEKRGLPEGFMHPVDATLENVSTSEELAGRFLGPILAILLISMALTGAFYPAVDLSAGEKERGTMETLLVCPAARFEIVMGKYLTVFAISFVTAVLNVAAMGLTFGQLTSMLPQQENMQMAFSVSPMVAVWMLVILVPLAGFFAGLCLAVATFAKSFKEGQNYLSPMLIVIMMLAMGAMLPGMQISLVTALVPVTGTSLLFKSLLVGDYAWYHVMVVLAANVFYALLAVSWVTESFNTEEILFRSGDELNWKFWTWKRFTPLPNKTEGIVVFLASFAINFFVSKWLLNVNLFLAIGAGFVVGFLAFPLAVSYLLRLNVNKTFRLRAPAAIDFGLSIIVAFASLMTAMAVVMLQNYVFSDSPAMRESQKQLYDFSEKLVKAGPIVLFTVLAVLPALCEEVLFRGFVLKAFQHKSSGLRAVLLSSILFGLAHMNPHQFLYAVVLGCAFGVLVIRTGSLFTAIFCHFIVNGTNALFSWQQIALSPALLGPAAVPALILSPILLVLTLYLTGRYGKKAGNS